MLVKILEVLLRDCSDLEDEGSEEECLKFKKVIWIVFIMSLITFPKLMRSSSFDIGQVLEVVLRKGSALEDKESEEEILCLKFKKVIWTDFIMSDYWKDRFDLKRHVTCLCDYQTTKIQS